MTATSLTKRLLRSTGFVTAYLFLGGITALIGSLVGTFLMLVFMPAYVAVVAVAFVKPILSGILLGLILATPLTFILFPIAALIIRGPVARHFGLPVIGVVSGGYVAWIWLALTSSHSSSYVAEMLIMAGAIAGAVSGITYAAALREMKR